MKYHFFLWCSSLFILLFPQPLLAAYAVVSEVMWMGTDLSSSDEWVEIAGVGEEGETIDLTGWKLTKLDGNDEEEIMMSFLTGTVIRSGEFQIMSNFSAQGSRLYEEPEFISTSISLPNTKLLLRLRDSEGNVIDEVDDGIGSPFAGTNISELKRASMERIDFFLPGTDKSNWITATTFIGFDDGAPLFGTPGFQNGTGPSIDIFPPHEVTNITAAMQDAGSSALLRVNWNPSSSLDAMSVTLNFLPVLSTDEEMITVPSSLHEVLIEEIPYGSGYGLRVQSVDTLGNQSEGVLISVEPLFKPNYSSSSVSSIPLDLPPRVMISEVLGSALQGEAWVEIHNIDTVAHDIAGWTIGDGDRSFIIPGLSSRIVASGEYAVFHRNELGFPLSGGGTLFLKRGETLVDTFSYPSLPRGVSYGRKVGNETWTEQYCVPTKGADNGSVPWQPHLAVQSGELQGIGSRSVNFIVQPGEITDESLRCIVNFGDGDVKESCNPPSHKFDQPGVYTVIAEATNYCSTTVSRQLSVEVLREDDQEEKGEDLDKSEHDEQKSSSINKTVGVIASGVSSSGKTVCEAGSSKIVISEVFPNPAGKDSIGEWIELKNIEAKSVRLCGWHLQSGKGKDTFALDDIVIAGGGFIVLPRSATHLSLRNEEEVIALEASGSIIDQLSYKKANEGESFARDADGSFAWTVAQTPGWENVIATMQRSRLDKDAHSSKSSTARKVAVRSSKKAKKSTRVKAAQNVDATSDLVASLKSVSSPASSLPSKDDVLAMSLAGGSLLLFALRKLKRT